MMIKYQKLPETKGSSAMIDLQAIIDGLEMVDDMNTVLPQCKTLWDLGFRS